MNQIEAVIQRTDFVQNPHLVITIDKVPLDKMLAAQFPQHQLNGLIPTLLNWMYDERESQIVWERILPNDITPTIAPILMCPDDLDFWCFLVVAEVSTRSDQVHWHRLGFDASKPEDLPEQVGSNVDWFDDLGPFTFDLTLYEQMLKTFRDSPS